MGRVTTVAGFFVLGAVLLTSACGGDGGQTSQVLSVDSCPATRCVGVQDALALTGWIFLEPTKVPPNFELYSRVVEHDPAPPAAGSGTGSYSVYDEYRFRDSPNVPGIILNESRPLSKADVTIQPQSPDCGPLTSSPAGSFYYAAGMIRVLPSPEGDVFLVCVNSEAGHSDTHSAVMALHGVLIEALAFPESGVTRDEFIQFIESLKPVSD